MVFKILFIFVNKKAEHMGFFRSLFSLNNDENDKETLEQEAAEKKRIAFETLCDNGLRAMNIKEYRLAAGYLAKAVELEPGNEKARSFLAEAYLNGNEMEKALPLLQEIAQQHPDNIKLQLSIAQAAAHLDEWNIMLQASLNAESMEPGNPTAKYMKGLAFHGMEDEEKAIVAFTETIELEPSYSPAHIMRSRALTALEKFDEAEADIDSIIAKGEADDNVYIQKGTLRERSGDNTGAALAYSHAIKANPFCGEAYLRKAAAEETAGNDSKALATLNEAVANIADPHEALSMRAALRGKLGDSAGAQQDFNKAEEIKRQIPEENKEIFTELQNKVENNIRNTNPLSF